MEALWNAICCNRARRKALEGIDSTVPLVSPLSSSSGCDDYFSRADVHELLKDLERDKPDHLHSWLAQYCDRVVKEQSATNSDNDQCCDVSDLNELLDWRFFIMNREKEIFAQSGQYVKRVLKELPNPVKQQLYSFIPKVIADAMQRGHISLEDSQRVHASSPITSAYKPIITQFDAAVVFADASGFTALTETLARQPRGAEQIGVCLNGFFGPLIQIVNEFGGDILKFSGDALTILWPVHGLAGTNPKSLQLREADSRQAALAAAKAACRCCLDIQAKVETFGQTPVPGVKLTLHIGVGFGPLSVLQVGGLLERWEYCAVGPPLDEVAIAEPAAKSGQTVVSPSVVEVLSSDAAIGFQLEPLPVGETPDGYVRLVDQASGSSNLEVSSISYPMSRVSFEKLDSRLLSRYIPTAVRERLKDTLSVGLDAEMRRMAVIFLSIRGISASSESEAARTQLLLHFFQRSVYALEGSINKFMVDDKGMVCLAVFGLTPVNHFTDDPMRAVLTATRLCDTLHEEGIDGRAGVATGNAWCGVIGNDIRREYTVLGDVVNLSARLMGKAEKNTVLVDKTTFDACKKLLQFDHLGEMSLKGKSGQTAVYRFNGHLLSRLVQHEKQLQSKLFSWEEWPTKKALIKALETQLSHEEGPGGIVFVEGGPGRGKTEAAEHVMAWAKAKNFACLSGQNMNPTSTFAVPRLCWQEVFGELMQAASTDPVWARRTQSCKQGSVDLYQLVMMMLTAAGAEPDLIRWAPLLSFVLPGLTIGAKGVSAMLERDEQRTSSQPRLATLCTLLLDAFTSKSSKTDGTVVLLHIKRGTSFYHESYVHDQNIARALGDFCVNRRAAALGNGRPLILCVVSRGDILSDESLIDYAESLDGLVPATDLDWHGTEMYMCHLLKAPRGVDVCLVNYVFEACGGNPFSVEVLCRQLEEKGITVRTEDGAVNASPGCVLYNLGYPEDLKGMALAAFEKLTHQQQVLLKAAAVCSEEEQDIFALHPFSISDLVLCLNTMTVEEIQEHCESLVKEDILVEILPFDEHSVEGHHSDACGSFVSPRRSTRFSEVKRMSSRRTRTSTTSTSSDGDVSYKFVSKLLQHVASTLILELQKKRLQSLVTVRGSTVRQSRMYGGYLCK